MSRAADIAEQLGTVVRGGLLAAALGLSLAVALKPGAAEGGTAAAPQQLCWRQDALTAFEREGLAWPTRLAQASAKL